MTGSGDKQTDMPPGPLVVNAPQMRELLTFLREICQRLVECGCSSNRVELLAQTLGASWGFEVESVAIPTGVWISIRKDGQNLVDLTRVRNWSIDLNRLANINVLVESIYEHRISIDEATRRLAEESRSPPPYSMLLTLIAGGGTCPALIYVYGGKPIEVALAFPVGILVQYLQKYVFVGENRVYLGDCLSAAAVALCACFAHQVFPSLDVPLFIVGGIVALVPGLVLVNAVHEVAQKNLVSGAAKLLEALMITASLGCGVVFVLGLWLILGGH